MKISNALRDLLEEKKEQGHNYISPLGDSDIFVVGENEMYQELGKVDIGDRKDVEGTVWVIKESEDDLADLFIPEQPLVRELDDLLDVGVGASISELLDKE